MVIRCGCLDPSLLTGAFPKEVHSKECNGGGHIPSFTTQPFFRFLHLLMEWPLPQNMDLIVYSFMS